MNSKHTRRRYEKRRLTTVLAALLFLAPLIGLSAALADEGLPEAEAVMDKFVKASGGLKAYDKVKNRVIKGTLEIAGQGLSLDLTIYMAKPGLSYTLVESEMTGKIEKGTKGEVAWENSMMAGPRIVEGGERALQMQAATVDAMAYWRDNFENVKTVGEENVGERACYKLVMTPKGAKEQTVFFDKQTGLVTKTEMLVETPMGEVPLTSLALDYREVDGILLAHSGEIEVLGQKRVMTMNSMEHNVDIPAGLFDLPEPVQALLNKPEPTE